ncbi:MAG: cupin domain-containing protein [Halopseudomonas sp.]|uniref:cupin domain-containing protein n=1 Tax=Halopseudomonas sp. TaxID=2901191 RepID=UPI003003581C
MAEFVPLNMARQLSVCIRPGDQSWQAAPQAPIRRWPLEREAPESGQVTSLVEYLPGARFPAHRHPQGEEILVLAGVFSDDSGDYPAGSYLRSPAGSSHSPPSAAGCLLFVKLNQFAADDSQTLRCGPEQLPWHFAAPGQRQCLLHRHHHEQTLLIECAAGAELVWPRSTATQQHDGELLVLQGWLREQAPREESLECQELPCHSWLRDPRLCHHRLYAIEPSRLLLKLGTLRGL